MNSYYFASSHGFPCNFHWVNSVQKEKGIAQVTRRWLKNDFLTKSLLTECDYVSFDSESSLLVRIIFVENCRQNMLGV
jgi:hypothetical protein